MRPWTDAEIAERREDIEWMVATGETLEGACHRLGLTRAGLDKWCQRHAPELWRGLLANSAYGRVAWGRISKWVPQSLR